MERGAIIIGKIYVIMGKSATGKDTIYHELLVRHNNIIPVIPYTTRPIRAGEKNGKEYYFVTEKKFWELNESGNVIEYRFYKTMHGIWYYFTANDNQFQNLDNIYCLISTISGYIKLKNFFGKNRVVPIYIEVPDITRIQRSLSREAHQKNPCVSEVCRRFLADEKDFSEENITFAGIQNRIINENLEEALSEIEKIILR